MKSHSISIRLAAATMALFYSVSSATAALFSGLYAFGDSLTDTGNTSLASGGASPGAAYHNGRYSNGPVWVEKLSGYLGMGAVAPSLMGGKDYAFGGAFTQTGGQVPTLAQQAGMFIGGGGTFLPTDLVVVWGGANDFLLGGQTNPTIPAGNIAGVISTLAGAGARNFLIPNLPDLGDTPELLSTGNASMIGGMSFLSQGFNLALDSQLDNLRQTQGLTIWELDVFSIGKELGANPGQFGFTNTTQSALLTGNAAIADSYLYWDTVHPTAKVHDIFAQEGYRIVPEPGSAVLILLAGFVASQRRRRSVAGAALLRIANREDQENVAGGGGDGFGAGLRGSFRCGEMWQQAGRPPLRPLCPAGVVGAKHHPRGRKVAD